MKMMRAISRMLGRRSGAGADDRGGQPLPEGRGHARNWQSIAVSETDIDNGNYKMHLGGGPAQWDLRGSFQLFLLKKMGMLPSSRLLDVGCGPARAGVHFVRYLEAGNYFGFDFNADFVKAARLLCEQEGLSAKQPRFEQVENFELGPRETGYDYAIAFSVLNHCEPDLRKRFLAMLDKSLKRGGRACVSHAFWFTNAHLAGTDIALTNTFTDREVSIREWGWPEPEKERVFPIIELTRR